MVRSLFMLGAIALTMVSTATAQVTFERKYPEGQRARTEVESSADQTLTLAGMAVETKTDSFIVVNSQIGQRDAEGNLKVAQKFETFQSNMELPGGITVNFDSGNANNSSDIEQLNSLLEMFRVMSESSWTLILDKSNDLVRVENEDNLESSIDETYQELFSTEYREQIAEQEMNRLPSDPIKVGESWKKTEMAKLGAGQTFEFEKTYEYVGTIEQDGRTLDKITSKTTDVTYTMEPTGNIPLEVTDSDLEVETLKGTILFDREAGSIVSSEESVKISGSMTFSVNGQVLPGSLDLVMTNNSKTEKVSE